LSNAVAMKVEETRHSQLNAVEDGHNFQQFVVERLTYEILPHRTISQFINDDYVIVH